MQNVTTSPKIKFSDFIEKVDELFSVFMWIQPSKYVGHGYIEKEGEKACVLQYEGNCVFRSVGGKIDKIMKVICEYFNVEAIDEPRIC